ncbi:MAG: hypothetical protein ACI8UG_001634 [Gammaproteobacteria bacterium]|jgi:hypothetical protein
MSADNDANQIKSNQIKKRANKPVFGLSDILLKT